MFEVVKNTILITGLVIIMMIMLEYFTIRTRGKWMQPFNQSLWKQLILAGIIGVIPGCFGPYMIVTMYTHQIIGFAGLVTAMIASSGDEAFIMFSLMPLTALKLTLVIFCIAIVSGFIVAIFINKRGLFSFTDKHIEVHIDDNECIGRVNYSNILNNFKQISFHRTLLILGLIMFLFSLLAGDIGHSHNAHGHHNENHFIQFGLVENIIFFILTIFTLFIIVTVPEHFLIKHLWGHIIKKHLLKIILWTLGALLFIHILKDYLPINEWLKQNQYIVLIVAVLIGIIPESGPHIIFVSMFLNGTIPFSVLLANSIVQDGHGALPLLAESRKSFIILKLVNVFIGFIVGIIGIYLGF